MEISDLFFVVFAVGVFYAAVTCIYYASVRRYFGERPELRTCVRRTLANSVGLVVAYVTVALAAFQFLPVSIGYPIFVAAWVIHWALQLCLLGISQRRVHRLHTVVSSRPA